MACLVEEILARHPTTSTHMHEECQLQHRHKTYFILATTSCSWFNPWLVQAGLMLSEITFICAEGLFLAFLALYKPSLLVSATEGPMSDVHLDDC